MAAYRRDDWRREHAAGPPRSAGCPPAERHDLAQSEGPARDMRKPSGWPRARRLAKVVNLPSYRLPSCRLPCYRLPCSRHEAPFPPAFRQPSACASLTPALRQPPTVPPTIADHCRLWSVAL